MVREQALNFATQHRKGGFVQMIALLFRVRHAFIRVTCAVLVVDLWIWQVIVTAIGNLHIFWRLKAIHESRGRGTSLY